MTMTTPCTLCFCSLAGVSRSTTMVVAYLMTVTHYSWEDCLSAVKAVRSFVGPNYGFQQQLQEYQTTQVSEVHIWINTHMLNAHIQYLQKASSPLLHIAVLQPKLRRHFS